VNTQLKDYIEVKERVALFHDRYPEGSLQAKVSFVSTNGGEPFAVRAVAKAYRTPDDPRPGVGTVIEPYPGKTNFTRGAEAANAETSAWGRALVAIGISGSREIASLQEVMAQEEALTDRADVIDEARVTKLVDALSAAQKSYKAIGLALQAVGAEPPKINRQDSLRVALRSLAPDQADAFLEVVRGDA
jgi:hypothetical protein